MIDTRPAVADSAAKLTDREDPLNVLRSTAAVIRQAEDVSIDMDAISATAGRIARSGAAPPAWNTHYHFTGDERSVASFVLVLDTLNYCFWPEPRWVFDYEGEILDGYWALASSLKTAIRAGRPILDARYLSRMTPNELAELLGGQGRLALMEQRAAGLRELGRLALDRYDGDLAAIVESAGGDAIRLVEIARDCLPSYRDCVEYGDATVWLLKRAQILAADLYGALAGERPRRSGANRLAYNLRRLQDPANIAPFWRDEILEGSGPEGRWPATATGRQLAGGGNPVGDHMGRRATARRVAQTRHRPQRRTIGLAAVGRKPGDQSKRSAISSYIDYLLLSYTSDKPGYGFEIVAAAPDSPARSGRLTTPHGVVDTPAFIPVGTAGSVKSLTPDEVRELGAQITLANTYHLWLRPGQEVVRTLGGLHRFTGWEGPCLTDSGGFQVFSLGFGLEHGVGKIASMFPGQDGGTAAAAGQGALRHRRRWRVVQLTYRRPPAAPRSGNFYLDSTGARRGHYPGLRRVHLAPFILRIYQDGLEPDPSLGRGVPQGQRWRQPMAIRHNPGRRVSGPS